MSTKASTARRSTRGVMDVTTCDELNEALSHARHILSAINLLAEAETTPAHLIGGLAYAGERIVEAAIERVNEVQIVSARTEYTANDTAH